MLPFLLIIVVFYFLLIRPQQSRKPGRTCSATSKPAIASPPPAAFAALSHPSKTMPSSSAFPRYPPHRSGQKRYRFRHPGRNKVENFHENQSQDENHRHHRGSGHLHLGIFGIPHGVSGSALKQSLPNSIHLGLDLKGGMHLILQVRSTKPSAPRPTPMSATSRAICSRTESPAPPYQARSRIAGIHPGLRRSRRPQQRRALPAGSTYSTRFDVAPGVGNSWTLTMKPDGRSAAKQRALDQAIEVIQSRTIPASASPSSSLTSLAAIRSSSSCPASTTWDASRMSSSRPPALKPTKSSVAPFRTNNPPCSPLAASPAGFGAPPEPSWRFRQAVAAEWYELKKIPIWGGTDIRDAQPGHNPNTNEPEVDFFLTSAAGDDSPP